MRKNRSIIIIIALLVIYTTMAVFFLYQFSQFSQSQIQLENTEIALVNEKMDDVLQGDMKSETLQKELDSFVEEHPMEIVIREVATEEVMYSTMKTAEVWSIRELFHEDVVLYKSQGEVATDTGKYYVSYVIYNITDGVLIEQNFRKLLMYLSILLVLIMLSLTLIIFMLLRPLENLKKAVAKMNVMNLENLIDDDNVIASDLNRFAQNLNDTTTKVARQYTELEMALQFERERLLIMMDVSRAFVHDLKTPIHQTLLENELVLDQKKIKNEETKVLANYNINRADVALKQINEILSLMDTKVQDIESKIESFDFIVVFEQSWKVFQFFITQNELGFYPDVPEELWVEMNKVSSKLILHNMLSNAVKYAKENTEIAFIIDEPVDGYFTMTCTNEASSEDIERMSHSEELFALVDNDRDYSSGNGLYLLRELTGFLGGTFELITEGTQATIKVTLPLVQESVVLEDE